MDSPYLWIAPPLIGALIGYLTNYVAIRMLFRPLTPWRLFSLRIPMTPGVIPAKRHDLALNMGRMVGDHLLTSGDVTKALSAESFQTELRNLISAKVDDLLQRDLGPLPALIPPQFLPYFQEWFKTSRARALQHLYDHLDDERFAEALRRVLAERFSALLDRDLRALVPPEMLAGLVDFLENTVTDLLNSPEVEKWLTAYLDRRFAELLEEGRSPADLLPADLDSQLLNRLERETPGLLRKLAALLREPAMQTRIVETLCRAVEGFISSLGPLAAMLGNFIKTETIRNKINDYLSHNGDQLAEWLQDEKIQAQVSSVLREKGAALLNTPLKKLLEDVEPGKIAEARGATAARIIDFIKEPATVKTVANLLRESFEAWQDRDLQELLTLLFGPDGSARVESRIGDELIGLVRSPDFKAFLDRLLTDLIDNRLLPSPIGRLDSLLPEKGKEAIDDYLLEQTNTILVREVPDLVDSLKISGIVTRKVDSLDLLKLEGLLLGIMQEQFKYINLFGGLLGFIIGLFNLLFLLGR
ncbi:MAG: DUF445 family protein [Desulfurivibrionaceae bacterium]|nr:DUF445 family protein [Desulfobulbales bacterium]MDT8334815.1 DUF445 family protein [Desulfurivibrionaceae bacterium]